MFTDQLKVAKRHLFFVMERHGPLSHCISMRNNNSDWQHCSLYTHSHHRHKHDVRKL